MIITTAIHKFRGLLRSAKAYQAMDKGEMHLSVSPEMRKPQIYSLLKEIFGLNPIKVCTMVRKGQVKRMRYKYIKTQTWKKVIAHLPKEEMNKLQELINAAEQA